MGSFHTTNTSPWGRLIVKRCSPIAFGHDGVTPNRLFFTNQFVIVMEPIDVQ
jgi:hypothetical protein